MKGKKGIAVLISVTLLSLACGHKAEKSEEDQFVRELLSKMTLEEKVGQMTQVTIQVVSKQTGNAHQDHQLDPEKLEEAILKYHVGSILNVWDKAHTPEYWHEIIGAIDANVQKTQNKIPVIYGIDAIHGATYTAGATLFPQSIAIAASRNLDLLRKSADITAMETRASGIPWNFNPVLGMGRNPLWPRLWETFGEDTYLAKTMGRIYVEHMQGEDVSADNRVAACAKHYLGYSVPTTGKDRTPALIPIRELRETFLPTFAAAVDAGALTVMVNSSEINGEPVHASYFYLTELLKNELGFEGFIVTDWNDINNLYEREKVAKDQREAVKMAVLAGNDMSMVPYDYSFFIHLIDLVKSGEVPMSRIDDAVTRILKVKYRLGLFKSAVPDPKLIARIATTESQKVNLEAARDVMTLLKNENNTLPLKKDKKVLVTGPTANKISVLNGGWTITWQGDQEALYPREKYTVLEAIQKKIGKKNVIYAPGSDFDQNGNIRQAVQAAKDADAIVVCLGEEPYCETPGNINDLSLPDVQYELFKALAATGKPIVMVLIEGRPRIVRPIEEKANAILMAYLPGMEGAIAIADVLFGDVNPSGKLPFTYPRFVNDLMTYDHKTSEATPPNQYNPQWPFGFGLSYTTFKYDNLRLSSDILSPKTPLTITVTIKNSGKKAGKESVELYTRDEVASITPSVRKLKGFKKIELQPGESKDVTFTLNSEDLSFINRDLKRVTEPGDFTVMIGELSKGFIVK
ncbi:MAG TPA: beta-glucosidase [Candidatus Marinimicrobia bacterium]|nr:beta-glucosidase [Candidatus Neomarinimicrobiota bacterium]